MQREILDAAVVVSAVGLGLIKPVQIARYAIYDDAIIAVRINTDDNGININYNMIKAKRTQRALDEK